MHTSPYSLIHNECRADIGESMPSAYFASRMRSIPWTEEELAHIREVLKKLTAQRIGNLEDAEDLVQETILTMLRKAPEIDIEKGILVWAMGILRKKVGNYYRRTRRFHLLHGQVRHALRQYRPLSPESALHHAELCIVIEGMLQKLSPRERAAIDLYLAGKQTGEIALLLHPERYQNIVNWLHRGRKKLARQLSRYGYSRVAVEKRR